MESAMTFRQGVSGNPHGNRHRTRHLLNQEFMQALLLNFRHEGKRAIEKVARNQPAAYLKILALLVPREMQIEHTNRIKQMTDEESPESTQSAGTRCGRFVSYTAITLERLTCSFPNALGSVATDRPRLQKADYLGCERRSRGTDRKRNGDQSPGSRRILPPR